jgi:hypothetical protein
VTTPRPPRWILPVLAAAALGLPAPTRGAEGGTAPKSADIDLRADVVSIDPDSGAVEATGEVRIELEDALLLAASATFDPRAGRLALHGPFELITAERTIRGDGLEIDLAARTVVIASPATVVSGLVVAGVSARCEAGSCFVEDASATPCPGSAPFCGIEARRITLHPAGDIDLASPRLVIGDATVAALPWLRLRPPGSSGFLPPRLGWSPSAGPVLGPAGQIALGEHILAGGHVAARGISGYESGSWLAFGSGDLRVDHLYDSDNGHHGRWRFDLSQPLEGARLAADVDLLNDRVILDELAFDPAERALGHTASRVLLSGGGPDLAIESHAAFLQWLDGAGAPRRLLGPSAGVRVTLPPLAWDPPVWPGLALSLDRVSSLDGGPAPDALGRYAPAHTRLEARPSLDLSRRLSLFEVGARAQSLHQLWLPDGPGRHSINRQAAGAALHIDLPFEGHPCGMLHRLTPGIGYRLVVPLGGDVPPWLVDSRDLPAGGQGLEATVDNAFGETANPALSFSLRQRFHLPGFGADPGPAWAELRAGGGPEWLHVDLAGALDERSLRPSLLRAFFSTGDGSGSGLTTGGTWYGPGLGPHLEPSLAAAGLPELAAWPLTAPLRALELTEQASAALSRHVLVHGGVRVGVIPGPALHGVWYGLKLRALCGLATVGLTASHRPESPVPDVLLTLALLEL